MLNRHRHVDAVRGLHRKSWQGVPAEYSKCLVLAAVWPGSVPWRV
jgi:hypothetical protein